MVKFSFLMTKCRVCGTAIQGKYYRLMVYATPFMLVLYLFVFAIMVYIVLENPSEGFVGAMAAVLTFLVFLVPGIAVLVLLRNPWYICEECSRKEGFEKWKRQMEESKDAALGPGATEAEIIHSKLAGDSMVKGIVVRFSEKTRTRPPLFFVDSVIVAVNMERAGNYEEAIRSYESLGLYDEAGRVRAKGSIKKTVVVDLNELVDQLRYGGLVINYKCPSCGASITIDAKSDANGLKYCGYCGTAMDMQVLNDLLNTLLR
ncbi:MAG: zinc ribbon domain-containing protein [Methanomassiliicoccales archaeon]|nr:zinc ribbon domain-containing protein [Methanomassiliicoccales archaeon]